jgi:hypothetical protein
MCGWWKVFFIFTFCLTKKKQKVKNDKSFHPLCQIFELATKENSCAFGTCYFGAISKKLSFTPEPARLSFGPTLQGNEVMRLILICFCGLSERE